MLLDDPALAVLGLVDDPGHAQVYGNAVCAIVRPWEEHDRDLIGNGFPTATVTCTLIPGHGEAGWAAQQRMVAAILRLVPGDVCLANQDAAGPDLVRLGAVIHVNPAGFEAGDLVEFGYRPACVVIGIPDRRW